MNTFQKTLQIDWKKLPNLIIVLAVIVAVLASAVNTQNVQALSGLTITAITPYATLDSNSSCTDGPRSMFIQVRVTNTSGGTLNNLTATLDFATSTPGGSHTGNWQLDSGESPTRYIGTLAAGASANLYYFVNYPCESVGGVPPEITKNYSMTVSNGTAPDVTQALTLTTRHEISANAGGQLITFDIAAGAALGQVIKMETVYTFGNVGAGNDMGIQPAGNTSFDSSCYRLIGSDVTAVNGTADWTGSVSTSDDNILYKTGVSSQGTGNTLTVDYYFQVVCGTGTTTTLNPWADMVSGTQEKYTGNFGSCTSTPCDAFTPPTSNPLTITKQVSTTSLPTGSCSKQLKSICKLS